MFFMPKIIKKGVKSMKKIFKTDETGQLIKDNQLNLQKINLDN